MEEHAGVPAVEVGAAPAAAVSLARRVFAGTGVITAASVAVRALAILSAPVLTTLLGPAAYGEAALLSTLTALVSTIALLGIDMAYARYYFGGVSDDALAVERFCWKYAAGWGTLVSLLGTACWVLVVAPRYGASRGLGALVAAGGMLAVFSSLAQVRVRLLGRYPRLATALIASGVAGTGATILLAWGWRRDAWPLLLGAAVASATLVAVSGVPPLRGLLRPSGLTAAQRSAVMRLGLPGVGTALMYWVLSSGDRFVIQAYLPREVLGTYAFAAGLATTGLMLNSAIVTVWFPEAARAYESDRENAPAELGRLWGRLVVLLGVAWLAMAMAGGDLIRLLADPRFAVGARYVPWLAGGVFFYGVASLASTGLMLSLNLVPAPLWWLAGIAFSAVINFTFVPRVGATAAAVAMCMAFALIAVGVMWSAERFQPLQVRWGVLLPLLAGILAVGVAGSGAWLASPLASLLVKLPCGMAAAVLAVRVIAPDWFERGLARAAAALRLRGG